MDALTNAYQDAYERNGWVERIADPSTALQRRALERLAAAAINGVNAEEREPGCTTKPLGWWQGEVRRWRRGVAFLGEQGQ